MQAMLAPIECLCSLSAFCHVDNVTCDHAFWVRVLRSLTYLLTESCGFGTRARCMNREASETRLREALERGWPRADVTPYNKDIPIICISPSWVYHYNIQISPW